jgi:hypothetical protein
MFSTRSVRVNSNKPNQMIAHGGETPPGQPAGRRRSDAIGVRSKQKTRRIPAGLVENALFVS